MTSGKWVLVREGDIRRSNDK